MVCSGDTAGQKWGPSWLIPGSWGKRGNQNLCNLAPWDISLSDSQFGDGDLGAWLIDLFQVAVLLIAVKSPAASPGTHRPVSVRWDARQPPC